jgi:acyl transferase domain-containing protein
LFESPYIQNIQKEPIAIIGMGCRFPGAENLRAFWKLLCEGKDAIREVPADRWDVDVLDHCDFDKAEKAACRLGGFLDQIDLFDWRTFRIPPHEAKYIDPQHRLLLEVAWEALEDAGLPLEKVAGSRSGVFVGISWNDYLRLQTRNWPQISEYMATGGSLLFASSRLSYFFDLRGPSLSTDVGCISSLTSLHLACQCLWNHEAEMALAGGVNLILSPDITLATSKAGLLAANGRCKTLDAQADGFVRGEGAGILILKPLSQVDVTDRVYAVINSVTTNHNGHNDWITAPSQSAQESLLKDAYGNAYIDPATVDYVELHGTGFLKGDYVETAALGTVIGDQPGRQHPCLIGSVKTNIGHLEPASGVASVIKVALSLYHRQIPPTLHLETVNPAIPLQKWQLEPVLKLRQWPDKGKEELPVAGVTALAMSGANAHVVLSAPRRRSLAPVTQPEETDAHKLCQTYPQLLPLSSTNAQSLIAQVKAWSDFLRDEEVTKAFSWRDICYTASMRRSHHSYRHFVVSQTSHDAAAALQAFLQSEHTVQNITARPASKARPALKLAWLFPHPTTEQHFLQESAYWSYPAFKNAVAECEQAYQEICGHPLIGANIEASPTHPTGDLQTLALHLTYQIALARLMQACGIVPAALLGVGTGQIAADCIAHKSSLHEALQALFLAARSQAPLTSDSTEFSACQQAEYEMSIVLGNPEPSPEEFFELIGNIYARGCDINWSALYPDDRCCVSLPPYAWNREHLWFTTTPPQVSSPDSKDTCAQECPPDPLATSSDAQEKPPALLTQLLTKPRKQWKVFLQETLTSYVSELLELDEKQKLSPIQGLFDAGMRSLAATRLVKHLQTELDWSLSQLLIFNYPTIESLCDYLCEKIEQEHSVDSQTVQSSNEDKKDKSQSMFISADSAAEQEITISLLAKLADIERKFL